MQQLKVRSTRQMYRLILDKENRVTDSLETCRASMFPVCIVVILIAQSKLFPRSKLCLHIKPVADLSASTSLSQHMFSSQQDGLRAKRRASRKRWAGKSQCLVFPGAYHSYDGREQNFAYSTSHLSLAG